MDEAAAEAPAPTLDPFNGIDGIEQITLRALDRINECLQGRGQQASRTGGYEIASAGTWLAKRQLARTTYAGNLQHRQLLGGVFNVAGGNLSLRTMARIISLRAAKQAADLVGSDPFMQAMPAKIVSQGQARLSKQVEMKVQEEIAGSNLRMALAEGIRVALSEGECPMKITWEKDATKFLDDAEVAVDETGAPLMTPSGQYIFRKDDVLPVVVDAAGKTVRKAQTGPDGAPTETLNQGETIQLRLQKEPAFIFTADPVYAEVPGLLQTIVHRDGLHAASLFTEDFIYPPFVPSLEDRACDIMVHRYDAILESVANEYQNAGYLDQRPLAQSAPQSTQGDALPGKGEEARNTRTQETIGIYETYYRVWMQVPGGQPFETWLFIVIDIAARLPIYAQFLGRMRMKRPPFFLLRGLESEPGRAYGVGIYDKFSDRDVMIDCWFNRAAQKSSQTNSLTCAHSDGLEEIKDRKGLEFGTTKVYRILAGSEYGANNPPVFRINLSEMSDKEFELLQTLIQSGEVEFGMTSAADGAAGNDTISNGTATAVRSIERTGNVLNESSEALQAGDIEKGLEIAVDAILENMDTGEAIWIPGEDVLATLNREEIRNLPRDVRIMVNKAKGSDLIEISTAAKNTIIEYYTLPAQRRRDVRDQFIEILRNLKVPDADDKVREVTDEEIQAEAEAAQKQEQAPITVNIRLADLDHLAPSERDAICQKYLGIRGAPPEEIMAMKEQEAQLEIAKTEAAAEAKPAPQAPKKAPSK